MASWLANGWPLELVTLLVQSPIMLPLLGLCGGYMGDRGVGRGYELARMERPVRRSSTQLSACYIVGVVLNRAAWLRRPARDQDGMGKGGSGCRARAQPRAEPKKGKKLLLLLLLQTAPEGRPDTRGVTDFIAAIVRRLPSCCNKQQQQGGKRES